MKKQTQKEMLYKKVELLEKMLGLPLETNIWHNHFSVYTRGENNSCQEQLVCSDKVQGAIAQLSAIIDTLYVVQKNKAVQSEN
jgi:hypothetical protein